jgi:hypothetical protein
MEALESVERASDTSTLARAVESATEPLSDRVSVELVREIMDWCKSDASISQLADTSRTYLCGHSRVGRPIRSHFTVVPSSSISLLCAAGRRAAFSRHAESQHWHLKKQLCMTALSMHAGCQIQDAACCCRYCEGAVPVQSSQHDNVCGSKSPKHHPQ